MTTPTPNRPVIVDPPSVRVRTDRGLIRAAANSIRYGLVEITAPTVERTDHRPPVNLAFVLDRSGSMSGPKIGTAKRAIEEALGRLEPTDRFAVVVYDDHIDVVAENLEATAANRRTALDTLRGIDARGSTNLGEGWLRGAEQVALRLAENGVNRVLLLTDGLANQGITDHDELVRHASELRARGVQTTTFGVGEDFDEQLLQAMADAGGGHFYFIASPAQIRDHISSEVGETLEVVARDVRIDITTPEGVSVRAVSPHAIESRGVRSTVAVGDLVSGQEVAVVVSFRFPTGDVGRELGALVAVVDRDGVFPADPAALAWGYADHAANDEQPRDREVDRAVATIYAAQARQEAVRLNRRGLYDDARRALRGVRRRVAEYAGRDAELRALVNALAGEEDRLAEAMPEYDRKQMHYLASTAARWRTPEGTSRRRS
jgi:Ca-activated chloride channel family protein